MLFRTTCAIARDVRVFAGGRQAMSVFLDRVNLSFISATVRSTVSVNVMILLNAFMLSKATFLCQFRPIMNALGVSSISNFITR